MIDVVLTLGTLALDAYTIFTKDDNDSDIDTESLILERLEFAKVCVSLWAHCCSLDGEFTEEEDEMTDSMISSLFDDDSLFPEELTNQEVVAEILIETFNDPLPIGSIIDTAKDNHQLAAIFYQDACLIFTADGTIEDEEREFLDDLASELGLSRMDKKMIDRKYLKLAIV